MDKLMSYTPLSIWRILIVTASLFTLVPVVALVFYSMDIPVTLARITMEMYGEKVMHDARFLVPMFGLLFIYGQIQKQSIAQATNDTTGTLPILTAIVFGLLNKLALLSMVVSSVVIVLDVSVIQGLWVFLGAVVASGAGASLKYALIDAVHPSQPLVIIAAILVTFLSSWIASDSTLSIFGIHIWCGYWAPAIGVLVGLTMSKDTEEKAE